MKKWQENDTQKKKRRKDSAWFPKKCQPKLDLASFYMQNENQNFRKLRLKLKFGQEQAHKSQKHL